MKKKYSELQEAYSKLEEKYFNEVQKTLDLEYKYRELEQEYKNNKNELKGMEEIHENTRRLKHDMRNYIMVVASYLNHNEIEEAKEYLSVVLDKLNKVYSYIHTGNSVMNYIINSKLESAQRENISFKVEIENLEFKKMGSVDFSALLGNILDNAIEACGKEEQPFIEVTIKKKRNYDTILIKNHISESVLEANTSLSTSKTDTGNHGIGIKQIREITEKYEGILDIYEEHGMFCVNVMIPIEQCEKNF